MTDQCMWNKKALCFRYVSMCKQMKPKYVKANEFEKGKEDKWPKHKAKAAKEDKKRRATIDGAGDMERIMSNMTANGLR